MGKNYLEERGNLAISMKTSLLLKLFKKSTVTLCSREHTGGRLTAAKYPLPSVNFKLPTSLSVFVCGLHIPLFVFGSIFA